MKSVLISIQPKWCELIASGKKTVEVRKKKPKLESPFKCYIYCTKVKFNPHEHLRNNLHYDDSTIKVREGQGKVIGEFLCDVVITAERSRYRALDSGDTQIESLELCDYADGKTVYGWNISELVIYDKPKELWEFAKPDKCPYNSPIGCTYGGHCYRTGQAKRCGDYVERPPQSWCYVEGGE